MNAPRQSGMSDWYLAAQLSNFKQGIRGRHPARSIRTADGTNGEDTERR